MRPGSYAFRYAEALPFLLLDSVGWQSADTSGYGNDGETRTDRGHVVFQYTLSGEGKFQYGDAIQPLSAGTAFLVKVPGKYRYYYEADSGEPWEFLWLNAKGEDALRMCDRILERRGPVMKLPAGSRSVQRLWELYRTVSEDRVTDAGELSTLVYGFLISLLDPTGPDVSPPGLPLPLRKATSFMKENYAAALSLEDIAAHCGLSRAYLCRLFQSALGVSPLEYLRRRRVEAAVTQLRRSDDSVQEIGKRCGFESPSYFGKVFRQYLGLSPREYRIRTDDYPFETVFLG